jgi:YL1 nuclear protein
MGASSNNVDACTAQMARRRTKSANAPEVKPLTQEELLAEAAKTELENQRSLQVRLRV